MVEKQYEPFDESSFFQGVPSTNEFIKTKKGSSVNFYKTKLCPFFLSGQCFKGNECSFAHYAEEIRKQPDLKKIKLCPMFKAGKCHNINCMFAHGINELRAPPDYYKTSLCVPFMSGKKCRNGNKCRFAHGHEELRPRPTLVGEKHLEKESSQLFEKQGSNLPSTSEEIKFFMNFEESKKQYQSSKLILFESLEEKLKKESIASQEARPTQFPQQFTQRFTSHFDVRPPNFGHSILQLPMSQMSLESLSEVKTTSDASSQNLSNYMH